MYKNITIKFKYSRYRKRKKSNFNPKLSSYWQQQYYDLFKKWSSNGKDKTKYLYM